MKNAKKIITTALIAILSVNLFALEVNKEKVSEGLKEFAETLLFTVPDASTQQNVWSDAYIGNIYPNINKHFGFGFSIGGTAIDMSGFKKAADSLIGDYNAVADALSSTPGFNIPDLEFGKIPEKFILPTASLDVRIGGFVLPFDFGLSAMMTNPAIFKVKLDDPSSIYDMSQAINFNFLGFDGSMDYLTIGADFRYRFYEGSLVMPVISVGVGYTYTKGNFKVGTSSDAEISGYGTQTTSVDMGMGFQTQVFYLQAQVSKNFGIVTPFIGGRALLSNTKTSYAWNYETKNDSYPALSKSDHDEGYVIADKASESYDEIKNGYWNLKGIEPQLYLGLSFNAGIFQFTLSGCADLRSFFDKVNYDEFIYSGALSTHIKF